MKRLLASLRNKSFAILIVAAILMELISAVQLSYMRNEIKREMEFKAQSELEAKSMAIDKLLSNVETAVNNHVWDASHILHQPDSMISVTQRVVAANPNITGSAISFIPDFYPQKGRIYEPYSVRRDGKIVSMQLAGPDHDYTKMDFFAEGIKSDSSRWSNPYLDDKGALGTLTTFTIPVRNREGKTVGVLDADVRLNWIDSVLNRSYLGGSSYNILASRSGQLISYPDETREMHSSLMDIASEINDTSFLKAGREMIAGNSGSISFVDNDGEKYYIYYAPVRDYGWSIGVVFSHDLIFGQLNRMRWYVGLGALGGLLLIGFILFRSGKNIVNLQEATAETEKINSELRIARDIQMGMIPKVFPERNDVDIYGVMTPAKQVGGDLFDFFFHDGKLYFCIGDVSGKGVPAALMMTVVRSLFRTVSPHDLSPARIVEEINRRVMENDDNGMFVTFFLGILDPSSGNLSFCNAGHDRPLLIHKDEVSSVKAQSNLPLGVMMDMTYVDETLLLHPGDILIAFTDGLTEARNRKGDFFGLEKTTDLLRSIVRSKISDSENIVLKIEESVAEFAKGEEQADDLTILAIKLK